MIRYERIIRAAVCASLIAGFHSAGFAEDARPVVRWGYMNDAEPINWLENGQPKGIEVEIVQECMDRLGIRVIHEFYPWKRAQMLLRDGSLDGIMTTPTSERFGYAVFGREITYPLYKSLFIRRGNSELETTVRGFTRLENLKPWRLIDYTGNGWAAEYMKKEDGYAIDYVTRFDQIPKLLAAGRYPLCICNASFMRWWGTKLGVMSEMQEIEVDWPNTRAYYVFMVSRKSPWMNKGLVRALDDEIRKMKASGKWAAILKKYRDPHGSGRPFRTDRGGQYSGRGGFYNGYESYPVYRPKR